MPVFLDHDDALALWRDTLVASLRGGGPDLSARQMSILLTVYTAPPPHTVRDLSEALAISRPAVSRALDRLCRLGYARRRHDEYDRRSMHIVRTELGTAFLDAFADRISQAGRALTSRTPFEGRNAVGRFRSPPRLFRSPRYRRRPP